MLARPMDTAKLPDTAAVLQLNCRRSHNVTYSLFNDSNVSNFLFLALQEPPVNPHTNLPSTHRGWHLIAHPPPDASESSRPRSCIYVNTQANPVIQPLHSKSRDLSACTVETQGCVILLLNVYNQPSTFLGFDALDALLRTLPSHILLLPTIVVTDSNLHSPLWNPVTYSPHDADADRLVDLMTNWSLYIRSPKGTPTYEAKAGMKSGVTIDLVWVNQQVKDILIACLVDTEDHLHHHSDHHALVTVVSLKCDDALDPGTVPSPERAWYKVDQAKFLAELKALLPHPSTPCSTADISALDHLISDSIISALNSSSPYKLQSHKHKAWWNPTILDPLRRAATKARRQSQSHPSDENRAIYHSARNRYFRAIDTEKTNSWGRYLSTLTVDTLFQAKRYVSGPKPSPLIATLIDPEGNCLVTNEDKARALFNSTCISTAECDMGDIPLKHFPRTNDPSATYLPSPDSYFTPSFIYETINDTHPMKAPGPDRM